MDEREREKKVTSMGEKKERSDKWKWRGKEREKRQTSLKLID